MRISLVLLLSLCLLFNSCLKKDSGCGYTDKSIVAPQSEQQAVKKYLDSVEFTANLNPSGFYYNIVNKGTGGTAGLCTQVQVSYTGKLIDGTVFDNQTNTVYTLGSLIEGWQKGIPLIQKGGHIKLFIPPTLGYGGSDVRDVSGQHVIIPANSILIFDITLINVQ